MKGVKRTICGYFLNPFILLKNQILIQGPIPDIFGEVAVWLKRARPVLSGAAGVPACGRQEGAQ
jgi:hypothetical protein